MKKILLIDDDETVHAVIKQCIKGMSIELDYCTNSISAIESLTAPSANYDLILLDVNLEMAGKVQRTGFNVIDESKTKTPFVTLTSITDIEIVLESVQRSVMGFIIKPIFLQNLQTQLLIGLSQAQIKKKTSVAFENNNNIDTLVGIVMEKYQVSRKDAGNKLKLHCRNNRIKMIDFAKETLDDYDSLQLTLTLD